MNEMNISKIEVANKVIAGLKALDKRDFTGAKLWVNGEKVRVYTGARGEYYDIADDGTAIRCRKNMTWSHLLNDAMKVVGVNETY